MITARNSPSPGKPPILLVEVEGAYVIDEDGHQTRLSPFDLSRHFECVEAVILNGDLSAMKLNPSLRERLERALKTLPFFVVLPDRVSPEFKCWLAQNISAFDRILTTKPRHWTPLAYQVIIPATEIEAVVSTVISDLKSDTQDSVRERGSQAYDPLRHWHARGQMGGLLGRAVCYANAPRVINKSMHAVQWDALLPAVSRAARQHRSSADRIRLLDYGCGIGRLAPLCQDHARYFGTDIAPSMIALARTLHQDATFMVTDEMLTGQFPKMDIVLLNTVMHHNAADTRNEILTNCARLSKRKLRLILLEDFIGPNQVSANMFPLNISDFLDDIARCFGGTCHLKGLRLVGYKPMDYLQRTVLMELDIER